MLSCVFDGSSKLRFHHLQNPFHVVLFQPEIPPNTGNIIRLCANTGSTLHLIHPLGFEFDDKRLRRAGLDYREFVDVRQHADFDALLAALRPDRWFALSTRGRQRYDTVQYRAGDVFVFGPETRGRTGWGTRRSPPPSSWG